MRMNDTPPASHKRLSIRHLVERAPDELAFVILAGTNGCDARYLTSERVQKLGLALAGFPDYIHSGRIQMIGKSEVAFLSTMDPEGRRRALANLSPDLIACILVTKGISPPSELIEFCQSNDLPLLSTSAISSRAIGLTTELLQEELAPEKTSHGVLMEMFGLGVLIVGDSGIGKSESALDLVSRKHRLVADDAVRIKRVGKRLVGSAPELTAGHLEIHGLGIVDVRELFGSTSVCGPTAIELCIELKKWEDVETIERIGLEMDETCVFDVALPKFVLPVRPGRNLSTLLETAVRVFLLRRNGSDAAQRLIDAHSEMLNAGNETVTRAMG